MYQFHIPQILAIKLFWNFDYLSFSQKFRNRNIWPFPPQGELTGLRNPLAPPRNHSNPLVPPEFRIRGKAGKWVGPRMVHRPMASYEKLSTDTRGIRKSNQIFPRRSLTGDIPPSTGDFPKKSSFSQILREKCQKWVRQHALQGAHMHVIS